MLAKSLFPIILNGKNYEANVNLKPPAIFLKRH